MKKQQETNGQDFGGRVRGLQQGPCQGGNEIEWYRGYPSKTGALISIQSAPHVHLLVTEN